MIDKMMYQAMMDRDWIVGWVDPHTSSGIMTSDTIRFTKDMSIERTNQDGQTETWASSCELQNGEITGKSSLQEFRIPLDTHNLVCYFPLPSSKQQALLSLALGTFLGTLTGAATGAIAGSPFLGTLIGLFAGFTGSIATQLSSGALGSRAGSGVIWVAEEGGAKSATAPSRFHSMRG